MQYLVIEKGNIFRTIKPHYSLFLILSTEVCDLILRLIDIAELSMEL